MASRPLPTLTDAKWRDYGGTRMGARTWIKTTHTGVRYREDATRLNGRIPDRYYTIRFSVHGKKLEEGLGWASEGWTTKKAASILAALRQSHVTGVGPQTLSELRQEQERQRNSLARERAMETSTTLARVVERHYLPWAKVNKNAWRDDAWRLRKHVLPALGQFPLSALTTAHLETLRDDLLRSGASPATTKHCLGLIRRVCNFAAATLIDGEPLFTGRNPATGLSMPAIENQRLRFLSQAEADRLIEATRRHKFRDLADAVTLAMNTGLRRGELQRLRWEDIDLEHRVLHVRGGAGRKPGGVAYLNADASGVLATRQQRRPPDAPLVFWPVGAGDERGRLVRDFQIAVDAAGLNQGVTDARQRVVFHTLRHTFASWLALAGTDIYRIKELMRHKTIAMTMRYAHLIPDAKRAAVDNLRGS